MHQLQSIPRFITVCCAAMLTAGCGSSDKESDIQATTDRGQSSRALSILTTFYPTQYFAQRIGGDLVKVTCPVPAEEDPIFWLPDSTVIQQYQSADLILLNGAGFAKWIDKVSLPQSRMLNTALPLEPDFIKYEDVIEHSHGKGGSHSHEGVDGHTWLDPLNAKVQAGEIRNALILRLPDAHETLEANFLSLAADLDGLDKQCREVAAAGLPALFCSHPAYNYIARRYGWNIANLDLDPAVMPSADEISIIAEKQKAHPATCILWESEPESGVAKLLEAELGLKSIIFSPCELQDSADSDYLSVMHANVARLRSILK